MGYTTEFDGVLNFTVEMKTPELAHLNTILGEEVSDHPEWEVKTDEYVNYIALQLSKDFSGIEWNGGEKVYGMEESVNIVIREMRKLMPEFGLSGQLHAKGEDFDDRWNLVIGEDGFAQKLEIPAIGEKITCPHCGENFRLLTNEPA